MLRRVGDIVARRRPSPGLVVALLALFIALGGSAVALRGKGTVRTDDIRRGAVTAKKIHKGAVNASKTGFTKFRFAGPEVSTTSNPPVSLLGGPSVTVFVPKGAVVAIYAEVEMRITNASEFAQAHLFEAANFPNSPQIMERGSTGFGVVRTKSGDNMGAASNAGGGAIFSGLAPGKHTFTLRYSATGGAATAIFRNRKLWVTVLN